MLTKVQYLPITSITNIPSINIIIPNTYIKVPHRGFWGFRQTRQVITPLLYKATQLTIPYSSTTHFKGKLKKAYVMTIFRPLMASKSDCLEYPLYVLYYRLHSR